MGTTLVTFTIEIPGKDEKKPEKDRCLVIVGDRLSVSLRDQDLNYKRMKEVLEKQKEHGSSDVFFQKVDKHFVPSNEYAKKKFASRLKRP